MLETASEDNDSYGRDVQELSHELEQDSPRSERVKLVMRKTFPGCRNWILQDNPTVTEVLGVFTCLNQSSRVRPNNLHCFRFKQYKPMVITKD